MWDSHHCTATLSFLWQRLFDWFWIYDGNNSEQSNNFPLAITLPFGTLSLRGKWMRWDLSMSLVALCEEQIKVRIQMQNTWLLNSHSGSSAWRLSTFLWHSTVCKMLFDFLSFSFHSDSGKEIPFSRIVREKSKTRNVAFLEFVIQQILIFFK